MLLTIWRHGEAADAATDFARRLTRRGEHDVLVGTQAFLQQCADLDLARPSELHFSPWTRTRMTAEIIARALNENGNCIQTEAAAISPESNVDKAEQLVAAIEREPSAPAHLLLVSHQPLVSRLIGFYLGDAGIVPPLNPGGYAILSLDPAAQGCGHVNCWALPPHYEGSR